VLRYLAAQAGLVPAAAISRDVGLPRSSTYHLLYTLVHEGFVAHLPEDRRYGLGLSSYELASGYSRQAPLQRLARRPLAALVDRTGLGAHLAVLHGADVVYLADERAPGRPPLVTDVGVRLPAALTASGRAMLACVPGPQIRALYPGTENFVRRTEAGPTSRAALHRLLAATRRNGYAEEHGEVTDGYSSVAVAALDHVGHPLAAVALTFLAGEIAGEEHARLVAALTRTTRELSHRIAGPAGSR
jgi:DNA-binding IclR family transcriptional regulator